MSSVKRIFAVFAVCLLLLAWAPSASASVGGDAAERLYELGLFRGTGTDSGGSPIFELDRSATRQEAVTMLVRLLGKEAEALAGKWSTPFTDLDDWAKPYVGYAYKNSLTSGTGAKTFGSAEKVTATQYITFVLRALGYQSGTDFQWDKAWLLSDELGITDGQYGAKTAFTRGDAAIVSLNALSASLKSGKSTLYDVVFPTSGAKLIYDGSSEADSVVVADVAKLSSGYVRVKYAAVSQARLKVKLTGPDGIEYVYDLPSGGVWSSLPLTGGSGQYTLAVYKNITGTRYSTVFSQALTVRLTDEFAPFLHSNQYVDYDSSARLSPLTAKVTAGSSKQLDVIRTVFEYVTSSLTYDTAKAANVTSGYLPVIDDVLNAGKGICFDYAAVMTAMLRLRDIPTKLVVGYISGSYHAWISVYTDETGWMDAIYFDGADWMLMDPTYSSGGDYIPNSADYTAKYSY